MVQNMENIDFRTFFAVTFTTMASNEVKLWFLSFVEHFWPDPYDTLSKFGLFFEKMHKVFKNKAQRCSTPLMKCKFTMFTLENGLHQVNSFSSFVCFGSLKN